MVAKEIFKQLPKEEIQILLYLLQKAEKQIYVEEELHWNYIKEEYKEYLQNCIQILDNIQWGIDLDLE